MQIEIITVKRKLSKAVVNQMRQAPLDALRYGKPLGFVIGIIKNSYKAILIEYEGDHYWIPANYIKGGIAVYRKIGKWSSSIKFESEYDCDEWWRTYEVVREKAVDHIYI